MTMGWQYSNTVAFSKGEQNEKSIMKRTFHLVLEYLKTPRVIKRIVFVLICCQLHLYAHAGLSSDNSKDKLTVTFLGNTTLYFSDGQTSIMIDGYVSRFGPARTFFGKVEHDKIQLDNALKNANIQSVDYIIPTHSHFDHALDAPHYLNKFSETQLFGSKTMIKMAEDIVHSLDKNAHRLTEIELDSENKFIPKLSLAADFEVIIENAIHGNNGKVAEFFAPLGELTQQVNFNQPQHIRKYREGKTFNVSIHHKKKE